MRFVRLRKKAARYLRLQREMKLLLVEAFFYLGWARMLKMLPFSRISPSLGVCMRETAMDCEPDRIALIRDISCAVRLMSRYTWWESKCLVMAIAAMKMLKRRGIESTLYLGTAKDAAGNMIAHAWLRSGSMYVTGAEFKDRFTVVATFGNMISHGKKIRE
ncbi:MAG TPA: lasso peptide biosynthesis B2 protein [Bacilli bacterium]